MSDTTHFTTAQRRARLVARHHLDRSAADPVAAAHGLVALHATDPITPHLACWARVPGFETGDLDGALCDERSLWRIHAMRRTLFVVPTSEGAVFRSAASLAIARKERARVKKWLGAALSVPVEPWLTRVEGAIVELLSDGEERWTKTLRAALPELGTEVLLGSGKWARASTIGPRILYVLAMEGRVVRTRAMGSWRSSQYGWAEGSGWFGGVAPMEPEAALEVLVRMYLARFGPVTFTDLRWWTGLTVRLLRAAVKALGAVEVSLENEAELGLVLPDDLERSPLGEGCCVALLPGLDPTPMGWKRRGWFMGGHDERLFDRNGNIGPTVWLDGRVVGGWAHRPEGVVFELLEDVGEHAEAIGARAAELSAWLEGVQVRARFRTPLERALLDR